MKNVVLGSVAALSLFGLAACSDTDNTTTQSVPPVVDDQAGPAQMAPAPVERNTAPESGTGGETELNQEPAPVPPAPAQ